MARIFLLRVGTELDFKSVNLQVRELGFSSDSEKLYLGTTKGNVNIPTEDIVRDIIAGELENFNSAYQIWLNNGNTGTEEDFLNSLVGNSGKSAYDIWLDLGNTGTEDDFIKSLGANSATEKTAMTLAPINNGDDEYYYEAELGDYDGSECVYEFMLTEFFDFTMNEDDNSIESASAPRIFAGMFFVPGGVSIPDSGSTLVVRTNINLADEYDQAYSLFVTSGSKIIVRIDTFGGNGDTNIAILTITQKMQTTTGIPTVSLTQHNT